MTTLAEHRYEPRGVLREIWQGPRARADELLVAGPAGTGKSRGCIEKMHAAACKYPHFRGAMMRKTNVSLTATGQVTYREHVAAEHIAAGLVQWFGGSQSEPPAWRYANGSTITVGGMDNPTKIMSTEYDMVYVQEATELNVKDWEAITTRLRNGRLPYQQLLADCNPDAPHHWLKKRCDEGQTQMLNSRHEDNPVYFNRDGTTTERGRAYMAKLDALTGVRYHRLRKGEWVAAEGQVYEQWDSAVHLIDRFPIPDDWARYWAIDFGFTNPFVLQFWAEDPDGRLYLYREIYRTQRTVDEHAKHALMLVTEPTGAQIEGEHPRDAIRAGRRRWTEPRPRRIVADHDAEGRATWAKETGMSTTAASKRKIDGIQAVQRRLRDRRLFILRDSTVERDTDLADAGKPACTAEEVLSYVWDRKGIRDPKIQEEPVKEDDHGMDTMRYLVMDRDRGAGTLRFI